MGRIPTLRKRWKPIARRSPSARRLLDRGTAGRTVSGAERLDAAWPPAGREAGVGPVEARGEGLGAAEPRRTACPRRPPRPAPGPSPPRCRCRPGLPGPAGRLPRPRGRGARRRRRGRWPRGAGARQGPPCSASATRSRMRRPPTISRPLGRPSNRVAPPPARMTPRTVSSGVRASSRARGRRR